MCNMQVEKAEQDKKSAIIRAEGEARSAQLLGEAIQHNPSFLNLRRIEVRFLSIPRSKTAGKPQSSDHNRLLF